MPRLIAAILVAAIVLIALIGEAMTDKQLRARAIGCAALIGVCILGLMLALWALVPAMPCVSC